MAKKDKGNKGSAADTTLSPTDLKPGELKTPIFRANYIGLPGDDGSYSVNAIFDNDVDLSDMHKLAQRAYKDEHGGSIELGDDGYPILDGDKRARKLDQPQFEGTMYCNLKSNYAPGAIVDIKGNDIDIDDVKELYSGAYYRAIITAYAWKNKKGNDIGVSFGLQALQKVRDGKVIAAAGMSKEKARAQFDDDVSAAEQAGSSGKKDKKKKDKKKKDKA